MIFKRDKSESPPDKVVPPHSSHGADKMDGGPLSPGNDERGPSSLLLNEGEGGLAVSFDEEAEAPSVRQTPSMPLTAGLTESVGPEGEVVGVVRLDDLPAEAPPEADALTFPPEEGKKRAPLAAPPNGALPASAPPAAGNEEELRIILLDEPTDAPPLDDKAPAGTVAKPAPAWSSTAQSPSNREAPADGEELRIVSLDDAAASEISTPEAGLPGSPAATRPPVAESAPSAEGEADVSALLIAGDVSPTAERLRPREPLASPSESEYSSGESFINGSSSLLMGTERTATPPAPEEPPVESRRAWRRQRERVRITPPGDSAKIEWFSNADACAIYCRRHHRPLLLYFTTGDVEQCQTYEEAIRRQEIQPFLSSYVCCLVNMAQIEGRKVAMRLGVPTDGPGIVVLSPSGREYARVLKPEVDWRFVATMLFWGLR